MKRSNIFLILVILFVYLPNNFFVQFFLVFTLENTRLGRVRRKMFFCYNLQLLFEIYCLNVYSGHFSLPLASMCMCKYAFYFFAESFLSKLEIRTTRRTDYFLNLSIMLSFFGGDKLCVIFFLLLLMTAAMMLRGFEKVFKDHRTKK